MKSKSWKYSIAFNLKYIILNKKNNGITQEIHLRFFIGSFNRVKNLYQPS